ncbi:MAG: hypothetical protein CVV44_08520 [Spirochaetae bacterium HGW-Spirochaetae-1]|jgi:hypothetical protein|nr:MAG: hypothetical protein CVV44_08520 [Spirochaetae bacterium HGW-Spirochaetae-1]
MKQFSVHIMAMIVVFSLTVGLNAADVTLPYYFVPDTPARASEVNENFEELENAVNEKVDRSGDTMTGDLTVPKVVYSTPREHRVAISGVQFRPRNSTDGYAIGSNGGTRITAANSTNFVIAQANLPNGATITSITYYIYDSDPANDLSVSGRVHNFATGSFSELHVPVKSNGSTPARQVLTVTGTAIDQGMAVVDNTDSTITIVVLPYTNCVWTASLYIVGVSITYTLSEAQ